MLVSIQKLVYLFFLAQQIELFKRRTLCQKHSLPANRRTRADVCVQNRKNNKFIVKKNLATKNKLNNNGTMYK